MSRASISRPSPNRSDWRAGSGSTRRCTSARRVRPTTSAPASTIVGVERVDHGFSLLDDPDLVADVVRPGVAFTVCPTSNRRIGLVDSVAAHPLMRMRDAGVLVTLNSDNAAMFDIDLADEYVNVRDAFGCSLDELEDFSLAAIGASWADDADEAGDAPRVPRRDGGAANRARHRARRRSSPTTRLT